jgi:hypothetical protein
MLPLMTVAVAPLCGVKVTSTSAMPEPPCAVTSMAVPCAVRTLVTESTTGGVDDWVAPALGDALSLGVPVSVGEAEPAGVGESVGV